MDNNKSAALVSVSDLSVVLQGVKRYIDSSNSQITIDRIVNREFGELVNGTVNGVFYQGIMTDIPAQEGLYVNIKNIRYDGDVRYTSTSGEECVEAKSDVNMMMQYPANLSGVISNIGTALGLVEYLGEGESSYFHGLIDLGLGYMVYIDDIGIKFTDKPFISYPLKLEVPSLVSPDYVESSIGNSSLREDIEFLKENGGSTTWDDLACTNLANVEVVEYINDNGETDHFLGIKLKDSWNYGDVVEVRNMRFTGEVEAFGGSWAHDLNYDGIPRDFKFELVPSEEMYRHEDGYDLWYCETNFVTAGMSAGFVVVGLPNGALYLTENCYGFTQMCPVSNSNKDDSPNYKVPMACSVSTLCPPEYIASPLGSASLKADVEMLQRKLDKVLQALQYATFTQDVSGILSDL